MQFLPPTALWFTALLSLASATFTNFSSYAPVYVDCPANQTWLRPAHGLSPAEAEWVYNKKLVVFDALTTYLDQLGMSDFNTTQYLELLQDGNYYDVPVVAMAISGGGVSSGLTGTGGLFAFDARQPESNNAKTGGILQCMTYLAGLSGGSWPVMGLTATNFPEIHDMIASWHLEINRNDIEKDKVYGASAPTLVKQVADKLEAGFNVSVTDYTGQTFAYEYIPGTNGARNVTMSSVATLSNFLNHKMPFPILQPTSLDSTDVSIFDIAVPNANATNYDVNPFEFGTWDGPHGAFTPMQYLGTTLYNGTAVNSSACVEGFDRMSFLFGTSAGAFNFWEIGALSNYTLASFPKRSSEESAAAAGLTSGHSRNKRDQHFPVATLDILVDLFQQYFNMSLPEIAYATVPNPFWGSQYSQPVVSDPSQLTLVDGSESGQALPLWNLIQPARKNDFIVAWDANDDAQPYSWSNGTNMYNTYIRANQANLPFPIVPPPTTFIAQNYTHTPVFFGCNTSLTTTPQTNPGPIVLYIPNSPWSAYTNYSFF